MKHRLRSFLGLVRVACDHYREYNSHVQKSLLEGIAVAAIHAREILNTSEFSTSADPNKCILLISDFAEEGLKSGDYETAFFWIRDSVCRIAGLPEDIQ